MPPAAEPAGAQTSAEAAEYYRTLYEEERQRREDMDRKLFWRRFNPQQGQPGEEGEKAAAARASTKDLRPAQVKLEEAERRLRCVTNSLLGLSHQLYFGEASQALSRAVLASLVIHLAPCRHTDPRLEELFLRIYYSEGFASAVPVSESAPEPVPPGHGFAHILERVNSDIESIRVEAAAASPRARPLERERVGVATPQGTYAYGLSPESRGMSGFKMRDPDYRSHALWKNSVQDEARTRGAMSPSKSPSKSAAAMASAKADRLAEVDRLAQGEPDRKTTARSTRRDDQDDKRLPGDDKDKKEKKDRKDKEDDGKDKKDKKEKKDKT